MSDRLRHVAGLLTQPWAITPDGFETVCAIIDRRVAGVRLTDEQIHALIAESRAEFESKHPSGAFPGGQSQGSSLAVISIYGTILPRPVMDVSGGGGAPLTRFMDVFRQADADPSVSAILLDIDSPGGSVSMVAEAAAVIASASTPTYAIANTMAGSAAYYLASQADEVIASPSALVGSIGVFARHVDISVALQQEGVAVSLVSAGQFKTEGNQYEPLSDEARAAMQVMVDEFYTQFVEAVAAGRGVSADDVRDGFGQGRMLTAYDALDAGMVDRVESFDATVSRLLAAPPLRSGGLLGTSATAVLGDAKTSPDSPADTASGADKPAHGARIARIQRGL